MAAKFNSMLPAQPESVETVLKVLSQNDELIIRDIARLGRLTESQARRALEELVESGKVVVRKLERPRKTFIVLRNCEKIGDRVFSSGIEWSKVGGSLET